MGDILQWGQLVEMPCALMHSTHSTGHMTAWPAWTRCICRTWFTAYLHDPCPVNQVSLIHRNYSSRYCIMVTGATAYRHIAQSKYIENVIKSLWGLEFEQWAEINEIVMYLSPSHGKEINYPNSQCSFYAFSPIWNIVMCSFLFVFAGCWTFVNKKERGREKKVI